MSSSQRLVKSEQKYALVLIFFPKYMKNTKP
nr:MAG TPA: hypothetical protein [Bacteriophage sp.]